MGPIGKIAVNVWILNGRNITERLILNVIDHSEIYVKIRDNRTGRSWFARGVCKCGNTGKA
jgi:hypothetical protein